ncbi:Antigenic thaumatin-like protein [Penicillium cinerascens]|uniref:Antigenic thaumatin-like protein n=1 Tax=Penicillium cinerascens TaxID=70096 RepID=A0A9W9TBC7_9EURO|nr:Antigenic thaumatin-like protein [Penicillium cinerascens]KAJ5216169.1 Antigenic thaumatin-like protein [Penicillium cinerascens]
MKFTNLLSILSLATLALSVPTGEINGKAKDIPWGAFPVSSSPAVSQPSATSNTTSNGVRNLGRAVVVNHCNVPIYIWSVGSTVGPQQTIPSYGRFSEIYRHDKESGGIALKISTMHDGLYSNSPMTVFAYNIADSKVWYDISDVFGDPFSGHHVVLRPAEPEIFWQNGIPPSGSMVRAQEDSVDLTLTVC